mmetsp:Transcript_93605/g.235856  ORF Transcript_93605/g.235856 Transcript_93605/m.235856 type:complete len:626 (-) Transcript_93605:115-1992(-)
MKQVREYFLNPYKPELFGCPLLTRLPARCSGPELYRVVWRLVRHLVPDLERSEGSWPFALSAVRRDGSACATCSWRRGCLGCPVPAEPGEREVDFSASKTFSIDWDPEVLQLHYKEKIAAYVHVDESVALASKERNKPEDLSRCLDELMKDETLAPRRCSDCSKKAGSDKETPHIKQIRLWGCPPLLLLQLNRFFHSSRRGSSWKLHTLVDFPARLDLRGRLAAGPVAEDVRPVFREGRRRRAEVGGASASEADSLACGGLRVGARAIASGRLAEILGAGPLVVSAVRRGEAGDRVEVTLPSGARHSCRPEQLTPLPEEPEDESAAVLHSLSRACPDYELYAVVNHIGGMGSGHYTAFVKRGHDRWFSCNDSRVLPISQEDVVSANAYLLFYARRDVMRREVELSDLFPAHPPGARMADPEVVKRSGLRRNPLRGRCSGTMHTTALGDAISDVTSEPESISEVASIASSLLGKVHSSHLHGSGAAPPIGGQTGGASGGGGGGVGSSATASRQRLECSNGHLILKRKPRVKWHQHWLRAIYCSLCNRKISRDSVRWRCRFHCDFDVCGECYIRRRRERHPTHGMPRKMGKEICRSADGFGARAGGGAAAGGGVAGVSGPLPEGGLS